MLNVLGMHQIVGDYNLEMHAFDEAFFQTLNECNAVQTAKVQFRPDQSVLYLSEFCIQ